MIKGLLLVIILLLLGQILLLPFQSINNIQYTLGLLISSINDINIY